MGSENNDSKQLTVGELSEKLAYCIEDISLFASDVANILGVSNSLIYKWRKDSTATISPSNYEKLRAFCDEYFPKTYLGRIEEQNKKRKKTLYKLSDICGFSFEDEEKVAVNYNTPMRYENAVKELQGIAYAVVFDNKLKRHEIKLIADWIIKNQEFIEKWPIDAIYKQLLIPIEQNEVSEQWKEDTIKLLRSISAGENLVKDIFDKVDVLELQDKKIVITGNFESGYKRKEIEEMLLEQGAYIGKKDTTYDTDFLIVGEKGSQAWRFGNYGRKIEAAIKLREENSGLKIIKESDFLELIKKA